MLDIVDIKFPDSKSTEVRREERMETELLDFNEEHYLADYFDEELISQYTSFKLFDNSSNLEGSYLFQK